MFKGKVAALLGTGVFILGAATGVQAQRNFSIGSLNAADQFINSCEGFRACMAELGYRDGHNVRYPCFNALSVTGATLRLPETRGRFDR